MRRFGLLCLLAVLCVLPAYSQFWDDFGWDEPHCQNCLWMERSLRLSPKQAAEYHRLVHAYGKKIEKETRRNYRYWDRAARNIYNFRMDRDRKIEYILSPQQFNRYVRYSRERPSIIHDYQGWYNNPHYRDYRPSNDCRHYEENYWNHRWNDAQHDYHWRDERRDDDNRNDRNHNNGHYRDNDRYDNKGRQPVKPRGDRNRERTRDRNHDSSRKGS